jgi:hypothetical protein
VHRAPVEAAEEKGPRPSRVPPIGAGMPTLPGMPQLPLPVLAAGAEEVVDRVGTLSPSQMNYASEFLGSLPEELREAVSEPFSARALIYALLLDPSSSVRDSQIERLRTEAEAKDFEETMRLAPIIAHLADAAHLPVVDLAMPSLRRMSPAQYATFRRQIEQLTTADLHISLFEYALSCILERHLDRGFGFKPAKSAKPMGSLTTHVVRVLSLLAWEGNDSEESARKAFDAGMRHYMRGDHTHSLLPRNECGLDKFDREARMLSTTPIGARRRILLACVACIAADRTATVREAELYRAIGDMLGCPIPPL